MKERGGETLFQITKTKQNRSKNENNKKWRKHPNLDKNNQKKEKKGKKNKQKTTKKKVIYIPVHPYILILYIYTFI